MILFSSPKPRRMDTEAVQQAAFRSWRRAFPHARIMLFGDTASWQGEMSALGMEAGGPLPRVEGGGEEIRAMFQSVVTQWPEEIHLYLNSDILLDDSSIQVTELLRSRPGPWLASARRWCLPGWAGPVPETPEAWGKFFTSAKQKGTHGEACALDLFLFRGLSFGEMPPFRIGHRGWDNWMIFHARAQGIPVIDLSRELRVIHCDHDYSYAQGNSAPGRRDGPLEDANLRLLGGEEKLFHLGHATHELRDGKVLSRKGGAIRQRNLELWQILHPGHHWWWAPVRSLFHPLLKRWQAATTREEDWTILRERSRAG